MTNHAIAKEKIRDLTYKISKKLYTLKYSNREYTVLDDRLYKRVNYICERNDIPAPFIKYNGKIYLDGDNPNLFCILVRLADDFGIVLDYENTL